ncbi:MAG: hypothetical protein M5U13_16490 [Thermoanaerobaculia bacterium]|nr:hypothetical protein [Thermoanaerobaculia bacterium]
MQRLRTIVSRAGLALFALALLMPVLAAGEEAAPGKVADIWVFWPKAGQEAQFETAVKEHVAWRKASGDPFRWTAFVPVVGTDMTHYVFYSGGHHWKDLDTQDAWAKGAKAGAKFAEQVGRFVERYEHELSELDDKHSRWKESEEYRFFGRSVLQLRPGAYGEMLEALGKVHKAATDGDWPFSYSVSWKIGGEGGMAVVYPYKSWADMADPETPFMKVLASSVGSEEEAKKVMEQLNRSFESSVYTIYELRPDLSTPK